MRCRFGIEPNRPAGRLSCRPRSLLYADARLLKNVRYHSSRKPALTCWPNAGCAKHPGYFGQSHRGEFASRSSVRRTDRPRCVGPQQVGVPTLCAQVERAAAENASTRIHLGVSALSALVIWACARRSRGPEEARIAYRPINITSRSCGPPWPSAPGAASRVITIT